MTLLEYTKKQEENSIIMQQIYSEFNKLLSMREEMLKQGYDTYEIDSMINLMEIGFKSWGVDI